METTAAGEDVEEQKEWLQDWLSQEFERQGWCDGSVAWNDVAKRRADLSNDANFQVRHANADESGLLRHSHRCRMSWKGAVATGYRCPLCRWRKDAAAEG